jgi:hypothetical protein
MEGAQWCLGGQSCLTGEIVDGVAVGAVGGAQWCGNGWGLAGELAESGAQEPACRRVLASLCHRPGQVHGVWGGLSEEERHRATKTSQGT